MMQLLDNAIAWLKDYYAREPVRVQSLVVSALVAVGAPVVIGGVPVVTIVGVVLGVLLAGQGVRSQVYAPATVAEIAAGSSDPGV